MLPSCPPIYPRPGLLWSGEHSGRVKGAIVLDHARHQPRPARLMAGAKARAVIAVEILVEEDVIPPVRIGLELPIAP